MARSIRLTQFLARADQIAGQLQGLHFSFYHAPMQAWQPPVNVYAHDDRFEVCVELAGVKKTAIDLKVDARRLVIRGERHSPDQHCEHPPCGRVLIMEIAEGPFERVLDFPVEVNPDKTAARQENGLLWITLPFA